MTYEIRETNFYLCSHFVLAIRKAKFHLTCSNPFPSTNSQLHYHPCSEPQWGRIFPLALIHISYCYPSQGDFSSEFLYLVELAFQSRSEKWLPKEHLLKGNGGKCDKPER